MKRERVILAARAFFVGLFLLGLACGWFAAESGATPWGHRAFMCIATGVMGLWFTFMPEMS